MRKICYSVAMSLDGFIAGPNGATDWIAFDPELDFRALWARFDTLLMGRRTFEAAVQRLPETSFQGKRVLVASRTWRQADRDGVAVLGRVDAEVLREVRAAATQDIWLMGGAELAGSLLAMGEVDEVDVMIVPVLLGSGVPLSSALADRTELVLQHHRVFASGLVWLRYAVKPRQVR